MNLLLKKEIIGSGNKCFEIAKRLNWHPSKISRIFNETYIPTDAEKHQLAGALGVGVGELFQEQPTVAV